MAALQAQAEPPPLEISEPLFPPTEPAQAEDLVISGGNPSEEMRQPPATLAESPEALGPIAPPTAEGLGDAVSAALEEASASVSEQAAPADETELLETPPEPTEVFFEAALTETVGNAPAPVLEDAATALEEPSHLIAPAPAATRAIRSASWRAANSPRTSTTRCARCRSMPSRTSRIPR